MSMITAELAALAVENRYDMILIASRRVRELRTGHAPQVEAQRNEISTALLEIESGFVGRDYLLKNPNIDRDHRRKNK